MSIQPVEDAAPVWAKRDLVLTECPRSYVTGESITWLEQFAVWKQLGGSAIEVQEARTLDAFLILEAELSAKEDYASADAERVDPSSYPSLFQ